MGPGNLYARRRGAARAEQIAVLEGLAHRQLVSPDTHALLAQWVDPATGEAGDTWDEPSRALLRETWRDVSRARKLPSEFVMRLSRASSLAQQAWITARAENRFAHFLPHLISLVGLKREEAEYLGYRASPYDALLDLYEPGATIAQITPLFAQLRAKLVPLLQRIQGSGVTIDEGCLHQSFDPARQLEFGRLVLVAMGYDFERGRLDQSAHPFTTSLHPTDVRVTTRVFEKDLPSCLFSCIHEGGMVCTTKGWIRAITGHRWVNRCRWDFTRASRACGKIASAAHARSGVASIPCFNRRFLSSSRMSLRIGFTRRSIVSRRR